MEADALFWNKVAAIGQVAGAAATFLAAWIALYLARSERDFRLRVTARFAHIVSADGSIPVLTIEVENIGLRTARVSGFGWTTGYLNRFALVPRALRLKSAFQMPDYVWQINPPFPWTLEPGEAKSTHMRRGEFLTEFSRPSSGDLFRRLPWKSTPTLLRHRVFVGVYTRKTVYRAKVDPAVTRALEDGYEG